MVGRVANVQAEENMKDEATGPHQACVADPWPCIFVSEWFGLGQFGIVYLEGSCLMWIFCLRRLIWVVLGLIGLRFFSFSDKLDRQRGMLVL